MQGRRQTCLEMIVALNDSLEHTAAIARNLDLQMVAQILHCRLHWQCCHPYEL